MVDGVLSTLSIVSFWMFVLLMALKILVLLWWRPRRLESHFAKQGIRGPPYRFLIGNAKELVELMLKSSSQPMPSFSHNILPRVLSFYHHWRKIYGATFIMWFGPTVRITVSEPDLIREVFISKSHLYEKVVAHPLLKKLEGHGLLSLEGVKWASHRKIIAPTFYMENLKLLVPVVSEIVTSWSDGLPEEEVQIDAFECFHTLTEDIITKIIFGDRGYAQGKPIIALQSQQMMLVADAFRKVLIPGYRFLPTKLNLTLWRLEREIVHSLNEFLEKRDDNLVSEHKSIVALMAQASSCDPTVSLGDIVEECKTFFFAGKQTTTNLLTWTMIMLSMHPSWQEAARDEVITVCGSHDSPSKDHVVKMKTMSMVINETLRLYPPVVATIRRSKTDVKLGDLNIPRGIELLIPILALHHDQAVWGPDANEFNPSRFADGAARAAKHPLAFIPFGVGTRNCIGQNLVILQIKVALAILLRRFEFRLAPHYRHAPTVKMLLYPEHGAPLILRRLPSSQL